MALRKRRRVDMTLRLADPARRLEPADPGSQLRIDEPVARRHGRPVPEEGLVLDDYRRLIETSDHDDETTAGLPPQQCGHDLVVIHLDRCDQRQNSSVCSIRDNSPEPEGVVAPARCPTWPVGVVVVVTPPGGSSEVADGVTGAAEPGSPA